MHRTVSLLPVLACCLVAAAPAVAQVQNRPARQGGAGVFGGGQAAPPAPSAAQTQQTLALTVSSMGSFDDRSRAEPVPGGGAELQPLDQRSAGVLDANLRYRVGNSRRWFNAFGAGFVTAHEAERALAGSEFRAGALTTLGRRDRIEASLSFRDAPFMSLAGFGDLALTVDPGVLPDSDPAFALNRQRSRTMNGLTGYSRDWTTRQSTSVGYTYSRTDFAEGSLGIEGRAHSLDLQHTWQFSRSAGIVGSYHTSRSRFIGEDLQPSSQSATVGFDYVRRLSPTRQIAFGAEGGAMYVEIITPEADALSGRWTPSASGHVRVDLGRSWAVATQYTRSPTVLHQAALRTFYSDAVAVNAGGLITRRLDATFTGSMALGRAPGGEGALGEYQTVSGVGQLRWAISRSIAAVVGYVYHDYRVMNVRVLEGFAVRSQSHGIRVGVSVWAPLIGPRRSQAPTR